MLKECIPLRGGHRTAKQVALERATAIAHEKRFLSLRLDAFGDDVDIERATQCNDGAHDGRTDRRREP